MLDKIKNNTKNQVLGSNEVGRDLNARDTTAASIMISQLEQRAGNDPYAIARTLQLRANWKTRIMLLNGSFDLAPVIDMHERAIRKAIETGDELLIGECCRNYGFFCVQFNLLEKAMFYMLKSLELQEKNGFEKFDAPGKFCMTVGDILYKVQEYEQSIRYMTKGLRDQHAENGDGSYNAFNTIGLAYQKLARYDSALTWYNKALPSAEKARDTAWTGIITGNIGDVYFLEKKYELAKNYLLKEYELNKNKEKLSAYTSLQWIARILAYQGNPDSGLLLLRQIETVPQIVYFHDDRNFYETKAEVFRALGISDSAFIYYKLFKQADDSVREKTMRSRMDITQVKLDYERSHNQVNLMVKEKKHERTKRYLLGAGIVLALLAGFILYRMQKKLLAKEKQNADEASKAARLQLEQFTANIVEKNELIESLQSQLQQQNEQINEELIRQTILTEEDWLKFRSLFEKARPGFFKKMQEAVPGITTAELRLAALLSLQLGTKHIAAMQGTTTDTVRKSKSRLRQRLNLPLEEDLEEFIKHI